LQRAVEAGNPSPLDLQFVSLDNGDPLGSELKVGLQVPGHSEPPPAAEEKLQQHYVRALRNAQLKAGTVPVLLAVRNLGSVGIRNLFIEIAIRPVGGACKVSTSAPWARPHDRWYASFSSHAFAADDEPSDEYGVKLARLTGNGLSEESGAWMLRLEWEALQPQRIRFVEPLTFLAFTASGEVEITARVYAESFAAPLMLNARLVAEVVAQTADSEALFAKAQASAAAEKERGIQFGSVKRIWTIGNEVSGTHIISSDAAEPAIVVEGHPAGS
jgi:hypothetical protein